MYKRQAEYRTLLRQDNADLRLTERSYTIGLASQERMERVKEKRQNVDKIKAVLLLQQVEPDEVNDLLQRKNSTPLTSRQKAAQLLLRPNLSLQEISRQIPALQQALTTLTAEELEQAEIQVKYDTYIQKEKELVQKMSQLEHLVIPDSFNYEKLVSLSTEARQKFIKIQPKTLGQASRISGVNPSDVQMRMLFIGR